MARYEVRVLLLDIENQNATQAHTTVEEKLREAGFARHRIVGVRAQGAVAAPVAARRRRLAKGRGDEFVGGSVLVGTVIFWWLWFWISL